MVINQTHAYRRMLVSVRVFSLSHVLFHNRYLQKLWFLTSNLDLEIQVIHRLLLVVDVAIFIFVVEVIIRKLIYHHTTTVSLQCPH